MHIIEPHALPVLRPVPRLGIERQDALPHPGVTLEVHRPALLRRELPARAAANPARIVLGHGVGARLCRHPEPAEHRVPVRVARCFHRRGRLRCPALSHDRRRKPHGPDDRTDAADDESLHSQILLVVPQRARSRSPSSVSRSSRGRKSCAPHPFLVPEASAEKGDMNDANASPALSSLSRSGNCWSLGGTSPMTTASKCRPGSPLRSGGDARMTNDGPAPPASDGDRTWRVPCRTSSSTLRREFPEHRDVVAPTGPFVDAHQLEPTGHYLGN